MNYMPHTNDEKLRSVIESIASAGFEPYEQIYGYYTTENDVFITRTGNARTLIKEIDRKILTEYIKKHKPK